MAGAAAQPNQLTMKGENGQDVVIDERLKQFDAKIIDLIMSEVSIWPLFMLTV